MKNLIFALLLCCASTGSVALAQDARMIKLSGEVLIKPAGATDFTLVQLGMPVGENAQVKTTAKGSCTISFDVKNKSLLTVKPNTSITVEGVKPGRVFMPEGRVFALIKNIKAAGKFEVRTPAAISGARGTGWSVEHLDGQTIAKCFDDVIYFASVNDKGEIVQETEIAEGFSAEVKIDESEENKGTAEATKGVVEETQGAADETKDAALDVSGAVSEGGEATAGELESTVPELEIHQISDEDKGEWSSFMETAVDMIQDDSTQMQGDVKGDDNAADPSSAVPAEGEQAVEQPSADGAVDETVGDGAIGDEMPGSEAIGEEVTGDEIFIDGSIEGKESGAEDDQFYVDKDFEKADDDDTAREIAAAQQQEVVQAVKDASATTLKQGSDTTTSSGGAAITP